MLKTHPKESEREASPSTVKQRHVSAGGNEQSVSGIEN
ncbi:hypothetical protein C5022_000002 [Pseudomonas phage vB_PaeP_130_113]|uniref:Uncharacterized protein n=3 Tax=Caudoviricetes TaxID=2731619 RepID=A0A2R4P951_9CAUD|nr:hypothetical protein HOT07_gp02 [Pseudomonas phage vB_PaeP_130_113]AVX47605.1 hypothetical protein C5022_000002 [Pseudomonas phage vB_PaeP_130_113]WFG36921.1 hypothetical protein 20Aug401_00026 [Pseudomonas phage 20Aug401]